MMNLAELAIVCVIPNLVMSTKSDFGPMSAKCWKFVHIFSNKTQREHPRCKIRKSIHNLKTISDLI